MPAMESASASSHPCCRVKRGDRKVTDPGDRAEAGASVFRAHHGVPGGGTAGSSAVGGLWGGQGFGGCGGLDGMGGSGGIGGKGCSSRFERLHSDAVVPFVGWCRRLPVQPKALVQTVSITRYAK
eukprot:78636-Prymnesium_polylepis.2